MRDTFFPARPIPSLYPAACRIGFRSRKPPVLMDFEHRGKSKEEWKQIYRGMIPMITAKIMHAMENTHT